MIYLFLLIYILLGVFISDTRFSHNGIKPYYFLWFVLVLISGLQYMVGSDTPYYVLEFQSTDWSGVNFSLLNESSRQVGWVMLENITKNIIPDFAFFKFCIALFVNSVLFHFFRKNTRYKYTAVLFYFCSLFFDLNFNILRQSLSIGFFVLFLMQLEGRKYILSIISLFATLLFHKSAFILFIVPLFFLIDLKKHYKWALLSLWGLFAIIRYIDFTSLISDLVGDTFFADFNVAYVENDAYGINSGFSFISLFFLIVYSYIFKWAVKESNFSKYTISVFFVYLLFFVLSCRIVMLGRIQQYFLPVQMVCTATFVHELAKRKIAISSRKMVITIFIIIFTIIPLKSFFSYNPRLGGGNYLQYYPYHSIFDKQIELKRQNLH